MNSNSQPAIATLVLTAVALIHSSFAQNADPVVYTVGNTYDVGGGTHYAYLLWQPGDATTTFGKSFAIYRKNGAANSANPYARLSVQSLQTSPGAIHALLKLGGMIDANAAAAAARINLLYSQTTLQPDEVIEPTPAAPDPVVAGQLATLFEIAAGDPEILQRLMFLGRTHPGVMISMGHAFAIKVTPNSLHTYEVREIDGPGNDLRVIGRVTLDAANPLMLARPGRPVAVPHPAPDPRTQLRHSGKDHLACRFRWGMPVALRRLVPHTFGYDLYRVKKDVAVSLNWDNPLNPPDISNLLALVQASSGNPDPNAKRVNQLPVLPDTVLTELEAANLADRETIFTHDDNEPPEHPFQSGEDFYYYVAARDIAGHPGPCSGGTYVIYCDRLPPPVPTIESVDNVHTAGTPEETARQEGYQHFRIRINQLPDLPEKNAPARYWIYRWTHSQESMFKGRNPLSNRVAVVNHVPGQRFVEYEDTGADAPGITPNDESDYGITHWYTVRAEDEQDPACAPFNLSGHSPPLWGVLRDRKGPGRATGTASRCLAFPLIEKLGVEPGSKSDFGLRGDQPGFIIRMTCRDPLINSYDVWVDDPTTKTNPDFESTRFATSSGIKTLCIPIPEQEGTVIEVRCRTRNGQVSSWSRTTDLLPPSSPGAANIYSYQCNVEARYTEIGNIPPAEFPVRHEFEGPDKMYAGPRGTITIPADAREWRVYRRTGPRGSYEMIGRGAGDALPPEEEWTDRAPPTVNDTAVCYFGQLFDENGNAGPLTQLACFTFSGGTLPIPMLEDIQHLESSADKAQIKLKWFCDTVGVDRFEVWAAAEGIDDPAVEGASLSNSLDASPSTVISTPDGEIVFTPYQTPRVTNPLFGESSPDFNLTLLVPDGKKVYFAVRAVTSGRFGNRTVGPWSNVVFDHWQEPSLPGQPVIPWPDRPLPTLQELGYDITKCVKGEGPFYAQKLPREAPGAAGIMVGSFLADSVNETESSTSFWRKTANNPLNNFFRFRNQQNGSPGADNLQSIIPFAVYRHQVANTSHPDVVPNLTQVTPLIDRITYKTKGQSLEVNDPFFLFPTTTFDPYQVRIPIAGTFERDGTFDTEVLTEQGSPPDYLKGCNGIMLVLDRLPVIQGRSYQYLLVHFDNRGEVERVIPTNIVSQ